MGAVRPGSAFAGAVAGSAVAGSAADRAAPRLSRAGQGAGSAAGGSSPRAPAAAARVAAVVVGADARAEPGTAFGGGDSAGAQPASRAATYQASAPATARPAEAQAFDLPTGFASLVGAQDDAWRELARIWGIAPLEGDPCAASQQRQIQCYRNPNITLALIRQLDRPGILTLRVGNASRTVTLVSLADYWRGEFTTLWRAPPGYSGRNVTSSAAPSARWIARHLAAARGETRPLAGGFDDTELRGWVHGFQLAQGLPSDGIAGPVTLMRLNRVIGIDEPKLAAEN